MKKLIATISVDLILTGAALAGAPSYTSGMNAFDSGLCRSQAGATAHTGVLGGWLHRPIQSSSYGIEPGAPLPGPAPAQVTPNLIVTLVGNNVRVSWPASANGFVLQERSSLDVGSSWTDVSPPYQDDGKERFILASPSQAGEFYRLKSTP